VQSRAFWEQFPSMITSRLIIQNPVLDPWMRRGGAKYLRLSQELEFLYGRGTKTSRIIILFGGSRNLVYLLVMEVPPNLRGCTEHCKPQVSSFLIEVQAWDRYKVARSMHVGSEGLRPACCIVRYLETHAFSVGNVSTCNLEILEYLNQIK